MAAKNVPVICYDLPTVSKFFRSVALTVATQKSITVEWQRYRDSRVLNFFYGLKSVFMESEGPGSVEVQVGGAKEVEAEADRLHAQYLSAWLKKVYESGPAAGNSYVAQMLSLREDCRGMIQGTFREVANINAEIAGQTGDFIVTLARVRLGAAVGIAVLGAGVSIAFVSAAAAGSAGGAGLTIMGVQAGAGAGTFGLTGLSYSMGNSLIKSWEGAPQAKVAAISTDAAKFGVSEGLGHVAGKTMDHALAKGGKAAHIIRSAEGEIRKYSERLAQEGLKRKAQAKATNIVANATARKAAQEQIVAKSGQILKGGRVLGTAVPVFFAAWDIMDAWSDYGDTVGAVR